MRCRWLGEQEHIKAVIGATMVRMLHDARTIGRVFEDQYVGYINYLCFRMRFDCIYVDADVDVMMSSPGSFFVRPGKGHCGGSLRPEAS